MQMDLVILVQGQDASVDPRALLDPIHIDLRRAIQKMACFPLSAHSGIQLPPVFCLLQLLKMPRSG